MSARHVDRIWLVAGGIAAVALLAIGWFLLIGPQRSETSDLGEQLSNTEMEITNLQRRLSDLREQDKEKAKYAAELAENREALPATVETPDFVREVQAAGDATGVSVSDVAIGEPMAVEGATPTAFSVPISLTADGTAVRLDRFLDQIQREQPRAALIGSANVTAPENATASSVLNMVITLEIFVSPAGGAAPASSESPAAASK